MIYNFTQNMFTLFVLYTMFIAVYQVPEGSEVQIGQLIAVTVEKGMDWKQAVISTSTKPSAAVASSSAQPTAPIDAKPPSSEQYVYCDFIILCKPISFIYSSLSFSNLQT